MHCSVLIVENNTGKTGSMFSTTVFLTTVLDEEGLGLIHVLYLQYR